MLRGILVIGFLLALAGQLPAEPGLWRLNPPTPSASEAGHQNQAEPDGRQNSAKSNPAAALSEADNPRPGPDKGEGFDYTSPDWWVAIFTALLAAIAIGQLIVFAFQARRLRQTVDAMKAAETRQTSDTAALIAATNVTAEAAKRSAAASIEANTITQKFFVTEQ